MSEQNTEILDHSEKLNHKIINVDIRIQHLLAEQINLAGLFCRVWCGGVN